MMIHDNMIHDSMTSHFSVRQEDLPTYWVDMCSGDHAKGMTLEDMNLIKNPERNTGYNGSHIWQAIRGGNMFDRGCGGEVA